MKMLLSPTDMRGSLAHQSDKEREQWSDGNKSNKDIEGSNNKKDEGKTKTGSWDMSTW